ncbi:MAG: peptidase [Gammaproteobacteria bacterium]|nr:MAG: peptidase [Gammaproteobacteria bacterium]
MYILIAGFTLFVLLGPSMWANSIIRKFHKTDTSLQGTGGELVEHLIERFQLEGVSLEETESGDHYDPESKCVRLSKENLEGRSITSVAIAAHEVGHAIQDFQSYKPLQARSQWVKKAQALEKLGSATALIAPFVLMLSKSPIIIALMAVSALSSMLVLTIVHLITLPVEFDASFGKALPVLEKGEYLTPDQLESAKKILLACALTYVAQSLASLLNIGRWLAILRR